MNVLCKGWLAISYCLVAASFVMFCCSHLALWQSVCVFETGTCRLPAGPCCVCGVRWNTIVLLAHLAPQPSRQVYKQAMKDGVLQSGFVASTDWVAHKLHHMGECVAADRIWGDYGCCKQYKIGISRLYAAVYTELMRTAYALHNMPCQSLISLRCCCTHCFGLCLSHDHD
jgi:hypothetical protein